MVERLEQDSDIDLNLHTKLKKRKDGDGAESGVLTKKTFLSGRRLMSHIQIRLL